MKKMSLLSIAFLFLISALCHSDTIHVPADQPTIQAAIDVAAEGDTVRVAPGTYVENIDFLGKSITVQSSDGAAVTTIDGSNPPDPDHGCVVTFQNGEDSDAELMGFTLTNGTGVRADYIPYFDYRYGGSIFCLGCNPTISYNTIIENEAEVGGGIYCREAFPAILNNSIEENISLYGGGISCYESLPLILDNTISLNQGSGILCTEHSDAFIANNSIIHNEANFGGGFDCYSSFPIVTNNFIADNISLSSGGGVACQFSVATFTNNMITGNSASLYGGGVFNSSSSVFKNNTISTNSSNHGGGIYCDKNAPEFSFNVIKENTARVAGGGVYCYYSSSAFSDNLISDNMAADNGGGVRGHNSDIVLLKNTIEANHAGDGAGVLIADGEVRIQGNVISDNVAADDGGGIYNYSSPAKIYDNRITGNSAQSGGGIYTRQDYNVKVANNIIAINSAVQGGGIYVESGSMLGTNNSIVGNSASEGGGLYTFKHSHAVSNSVFWDNSAGTGSQINLNTYGSSESTLSISYSIVQGGMASVHVDAGSVLNWGASMMDVDPLFVAPAEGDYHLTFPSPCMGSGDNMADGILEFDFEGDPRISQGVADMGADEFHTHLYCTGDFEPEGAIKGHFVGTPGTWPVGLFLGAYLIDPPLQHMWGEFYLGTPWLLIPLLPIPPDGILKLESAIPASPVAPYEIYMQALIGCALSNLFVVEVR